MPISNTSNNFMLWFAGVGGGDALAFVSGDPAVGGGNTAIALTYILNGNPNLFAPRDIVLDTVHDKFFFVDSDLAGHNRILQGSLSQVLANPGAPIFTTLYQDSASGANSAIRAIVIDPEHSQIFFDHGTTFDRINYNTALQAPTVLASLGSGAYYITYNTFNATGTVFLGSSRVTTFFGQDVVEDNFIYRATGLTPASASLSFSKIPFSPNDTAFGDPDVPPIGGNAFPQEHGTIRGIDYDPLTNTLYISTATVTLDTSTAQDGSELTTYYGGVFAYALTGNPTGTYTTLFQQDGVNGPVGQLGFIEVDPSTGRYFVVDVTGGPAAGDGGVYVGSTSGGTPTLFSTIGNPGNLSPQGLDLIHAPTLNGTEVGGTATEDGSLGSGFTNSVSPLASLNASDEDSAAFTDQLAGAQVRISAGFGSAPGSVEQLTINGTTAGVLDFGSQDITYSYNSLTGVLTLSGVSTFDNYESALALVAYAISGDNPDNYGTSTSRTLAYSLFDGLLYSDEQSVAITVQDTNDGPANTTGGPVAASEDAASVAVTGLSVSDVDDASLTVTLSVGRGTLTLASTAGLSFSDGDGTGDATMTFSGTASDINAALAGLSYTPTANVNGADSLTMTTSGGAASDVDNVAIIVAAVNDAPIVVGDGTEDAAPINQNSPSPVGQSVSSLFAGQYSDATDQVAGGSSADAFAGIAVTANGSGATGQWQYFNGAIWVNIGAASTSAAVLLDASTAIRFNPAPGFTGAAATLVAHLVDSSAGAIVSGALANLTVDGGTTPYSTDTVTLSQQVIDVNDAPTGVTGTLSVHEFPTNGDPVGTLVAQDPDSSSFTYTLINDAGGRFAMDSAGNVTVADGLLLDFEQQNVHTIRVQVDGQEGGVSQFDVNVSITDVLGENVTGDGRDNVMFGGAESDTFHGANGNDLLVGGGGMDFLYGDDGNDTLKGGDGTDSLIGGLGADILDGGAGSDLLTGGDGNDVFVLRKGEANGDVISDFWGKGNSDGDSIVLVGYADGTTFARVGPGSSNLYKIDDHGSVEYVTIMATGQVHSSDYEIVTVYDYNFM